MGKKQVLAVLSLFVFLFCVFALTNAQKCIFVYVYRGLENKW